MHTYVRNSVPIHTKFYLLWVIWNETLTSNFYPLMTLHVRSYKVKLSLEKIYCLEAPIISWFGVGSGTETFPCTFSIHIIFEFVNVKKLQQIFYQSHFGLTLFNDMYNVYSASIIYKTKIFNKSKGFFMVWLSTKYFQKLWSLSIRQYMSFLIHQ